MGSLRGSCAQIDDQRHLILAGQPQKIADSRHNIIFLIGRDLRGKSEKSPADTVLRALILLQQGKTLEPLRKKAPED